MLRFLTMNGLISEILSHSAQLPDLIEMVQYAPHLHKEIVPQIYKRTYHHRPWGEKWDSFEGFYPEGIFLLLNKAEQYYVGFIISYFFEGEPYIAAIGIEDQYRGQNLATCLVQKVAQHFAKLGFRKLWVEVNPREVGFYNRCLSMGFQGVEGGNSSGDNSSDPHIY